MRGAPAALGVTSKTPRAVAIGNRSRSQEQWRSADKLAERRQHDLSLARENTWA